MRKLIVAAAALAVLGLSVPAGAETVVIKKHRNWHPNHVVVIKKHRDNGWHRGWNHRHHDARVIVR